MEQLLIIPGKPIAQARPRFFSRGGFTRCYNPQSKEVKQTVKVIREQWKHKVLECPVILQMTFCMPITKGSKQVVADMLNGITKHIKRPDCTNLLKYYEDCLLGLVVKDDSQVYEIEGQKVYAQEPQTIVKVIW
jgi:Holliday junction resolvase RusA-like endonuclease